MLVQLYSVSRLLVMFLIQALHFCSIIPSGLEAVQLEGFLRLLLDNYDV